MESKLHAGQRAEGLQPNESVEVLLSFPPPPPAIARPLTCNLGQVADKIKLARNVFTSDMGSRWVKDVLCSQLSLYAGCCRPRGMVTQSGRVPVSARCLPFTA